ncbi:scavenger receptor class F member 1-like isoform X2 [Haliotis rufescens]|nr:scavenger receptor class F member 1-like isoform X2 [Haliotis rufescens]
MWPLGITVIAWMLIPTQGANCWSIQQCSECDAQTQGCLTECHRGYFGATYRDVCSTRCRNNTCHLLPDRGIGRCTYGCIPGFQGSNCQRPCYNNNGNCTRCPGGCDGEYCQMGGVCFSGCSDSYHGAGCRTCSSRCKSCNRITGTCEECQPPYSGLDCRSSCEHCVGGCESGCQQGCRQGFYGDNCTEACSDTCRADPSLSTDEQCPEGDSCTPECHSQTGECVHGCVDGWYGPKCSRRCNSDCTHQRCNRAGACIEGCAQRHIKYGCERCLEKCLNLTCALNIGPCCNGCNSGLAGDGCNLSCNLCQDDITDTSSSLCIPVYNITRYTCRYNCTNNASLSNCSTGSCDTDVQNPEASNTVTLTLVVLNIIIILVASFTCYVCYRKGLSTKRKHGANDEAVNAAQTDAPSREYMSLHHYEDMTEGDRVGQLPDEIQEGASTEQCRLVPVTEFSLD